MLTTSHLPVGLHRRRSVGILLNLFTAPFPEVLGSGMDMAIALWNFRRRGSTVTIGLTATLLPSNLVTCSEGMG